MEGRLKDRLNQSDSKHSDPLRNAERQIRCSNRLVSSMQRIENPDLNVSESCQRSNQACYDEVDE